MNALICVPFPTHRKVVPCRGAKALLLTVAAVLLPILSGWAEELRTLSGHVPAAVKGLQPLGGLPAGRPLRLAIGLPLRNRPALSNFLQRLYDPASPDYHHYLTPAEFTERFGPTRQDYQAVIRFARSHGLTVSATHDSRILLDVQGRVSDVEKAFHVTLRTYRP